jgi:FkbM family methyltransferase
MREFFSSIARRPPWGLRFLWRCWLSAVLRRLLRKEGVEHLVCYDIGARWGIWERFHRLPLPIFKVGFEADPEEAERLLKSKAFDVVIPSALSAGGGRKTLHLARDPGSSSIYGPDLALIAQHCDPRNFAVVREILLETITLQSAVDTFKIPAPDFIKLDVEGAELEILKGAGDLLDNCSGVFFEARLAAFYHGEPLFGVVASELLRRGFSLASFEPVGNFQGAIMLVDAGACRNLHLENRRQYLLKTAAFALLADNFEFALACLRKVASKNEILFGFLTD